MPRTVRLFWAATTLLAFSLLSTPALVGQGDGPQPDRTDPALANPPDAAAVFRELKSLVGEWVIQDSERDFRITFETVANETVLVETWYSGEVRRSLTVYHLDVGRLLATHYCPQGNQPRLVWDGGDSLERISFEFLDATNLPDPQHSHQHSLSFDFEGSVETMIRGESYLEAGQEQSDSLSLVRRR